MKVPRCKKKLLASISRIKDEWQYILHNFFFNVVKTSLNFQK